MKALALGTFAASLLFAADASAADNRLGLDFGLYVDSQDAQSDTVFTPVLEGRFGLSSRTSLDVAIPFTAADSASDEGLLIRLANPYVGIRFGFDLEVLELSVGGGVALPTSRVPDPTSDLSGFTRANAAFSSAAATRGFYDFWLWAPEALSIVVPAEASINLGLIKLRADGAWALLIPTGGEDTDTLAQLGAEGLLSLGLVGLGVRAQTVWLPTDSGLAQVSAGPVVELGIGPLSARAMFVFNLDEPAGTSFSDNSFWGLQLGAHITF